jgi:hypothetical protein
MTIAGTPALIIQRQNCWLKVQKFLLYVRWEARKIVCK